MAHNALVAQFEESGQRLVDHLLQSARQGSLELDVVNVDQVDVVDA